MTKRNGVLKEQQTEDYRIQLERVILQGLRAYMDVPIELACQSIGHLDAIVPITTKGTLGKFLATLSDQASPTIAVTEVVRCLVLDYHSTLLHILDAMDEDKEGDIFLFLEANMRADDPDLKLLRDRLLGGENGKS